MSSRNLMAGEWIGADDRLHGPFVCECHCVPPRPWQPPPIVPDPGMERLILELAALRERLCLRCRDIGPLDPLCDECLEREDRRLGSNLPPSVV